MGSILELMENSRIAYLKNGIGIDKFEIDVSYQKKPTSSTYSKQASIEKQLGSYKVMDDFKLATTLDPCF